MSDTKTTNQRTAILVTLTLTLFSSPAFAYLGPGAGLGMIGSLIAIVLVGLIVVFGLVIYPVRMLKKRRAKSRSDRAEARHSS